MNKNWNDLKNKLDEEQSQEFLTKLNKCRWVPVTSERTHVLLPWSRIDEKKIGNYIEYPADVRPQPLRW
jgi:hypothetical protein